jgi:hyperosmotically inducible protein
MTESWRIHRIINFGDAVIETSEKVAGNKNSHRLKFVIARFFLTYFRRAAMKQLKYLFNIFLALMLATALGCASTSTQESTGEYIDDSVITTRVKAAIFNEPSLKSAEINVETFKGEVQLSGFVGTEGDINKAADVARSVEGVTSVKNDMRVKGR